jgi:hypothetical protein
LSEQKPSRGVAGAAVFGASDGLMSILGSVMFTASRWPQLVFPIAFMGAVSAACSMGAGEFLGQEATNWAAVPVMGAATFTGSVLPALSRLWSSGWAALAQSAACPAVAVAVGHLRSWRRHRYAETVTVLALVVAVTVLCNHFMSAGGTG